MDNIRFEVVSTFENHHINLPRRSTRHSCGYDFEAAEELFIEPDKIKLIPTGIKVYMPSNVYLQINSRSSLAVQRNIVVAQGVGTIDADYYNNVKNEGHILIPLLNRGKDTAVVKKGDRVAQGIFIRYETTEDDQVEVIRVGGFGSTG